MAPLNNSDVSSETTEDLEEFFKDLSIVNTNKKSDRKDKSNEEKTAAIDDLITNINNIFIDETKYEIKTEDTSIADKIIDIINNSKDVNEKHPGKTKKYSCRTEPFSSRNSTNDNDQGINNLSSSSNNLPTSNYNQFLPLPAVANEGIDYLSDFSNDNINSDSLSNEYIFELQLLENIPNQFPVPNLPSQNNLDLSSEYNLNPTYTDLNQSPSQNNAYVANIPPNSNSNIYYADLNASPSSAYSPNNVDLNGSPSSAYSPNNVDLNGSPSSAYSPLSSHLDDNSSQPSPILYNLDQNPSLPLTLNNIDEIKQSYDAQNAMEKFADSDKELKKCIWININHQTIEELINLLKQLMNQTKINTTYVIKIYAIIFRLIKDETLRGKELLMKYFTTEKNILWKIFEKDHIILWNYLIELMQNLGINPNHLEHCEKPFLHYIIKNMKTDLNQMFEAVLNTPSVIDSSKKLFDIDECDKEGQSLMFIAIQQISNDDLKDVAIKNMTSIINQKPNMYSLCKLENTNLLHRAILLELKPEIIEKMFFDKNTTQFLLYHKDIFDFTPIDVLDYIQTPGYKKSVMNVIKNYLDEPYK